MSSVQKVQRRVNVGEAVRRQLNAHEKRRRWILTASVQWLADDMPSIKSNQSGHGGMKVGGGVGGVGELLE